MEQLSLDRVGGRSGWAEQEAVLATLVEEDNDAILVELCDRLEQVGVRISRATMGRIVQKLKLTRKNFARNWARHSKNTAVKSAVLAGVEQ